MAVTIPAVRRGAARRASHWYTSIQGTPDASARKQEYIKYILVPRQAIIQRTAMSIERLSRGVKL